MNSTIFVFGDSLSFETSSKAKEWTALIRKSFNKCQTNISEFYNLSIPGDTSTKLLQRIDSELKARNRNNNSKIVIFVGINDSQKYIKNNKYFINPEDFRKNISEISKVTKKYSSNVYIISIPPVNEIKTYPVIWRPSLYQTNSNIKEYNHLLHNVCIDNQINYINVFDKLIKYNKITYDGFHPNNFAHRIIYKEIITKIKEG